jgi:hypothetical protein
MWAGILSRISARYFITSIFLFGVLSTSNFARAEPRQGGKADPCDEIQLPTKVREQLKTIYPTWTIQNHQSLSKTALSRWSSQKPMGCPGAIEGEFLPDGTRAYILLIVPREYHDSRYQLVIMREVVGQNIRPETIETSEAPGACNYFLQMVRTSDYFSREKAKRFKPQAKESFLVLDAGEQEYEVDLYFWSEGRFNNSPVDE